MIPLEDEPDTELEMQPLATSSPEPQPPTSWLFNYFVHLSFTQKVGSLLFLTEDDDPVDFVQVFFWSDSFDVIAEQSNLYASQLGAGSEWAPTSRDELDHSKVSYWPWAYTNSLICLTTGASTLYLVHLV